VAGAAGGVRAEDRRDVGLASLDAASGMVKNEILLAWRSAGSKRYANPDPQKWESAARQTAEDHAPHGIDVL